MKSRLLIGLLLLTCSFSFSQQIWNSTTLTRDIILKANKKELANSKIFYSLNIEELRNILIKAPLRKILMIPKEVVVGFPMPDGSIENFYVAEAPNFNIELQSKYPKIKAYRGISVNDSSVKINFSISQLGVKTMRTAPGKTTVFIEPISENNKIYTVYTNLETKNDGSFKCLTKNEALFGDGLKKETFNRNADDMKLRTFRLALSTAGEYSQYFGGTLADVNAAINATMTRVNSIFEQDMAINMELIANNDALIFLDPLTDPYSNFENYGSELQSALNSIIGFNNYDIGHLFAFPEEGLSGNAGCIGCVCEVDKGRAYTSALVNQAPEGDKFDFAVCHEMGHQYGANHTFVYDEGTGANQEPGLGSTIMSYAGSGGSGEVQSYLDPYFHYYSILQVTTNIKSKTCPIETLISNNAPTVDAGSNYTIPSETPFKLTATGFDPDGDPLSFCWEQADVSNAEDFIVPDPFATSGPLFRSFLPQALPTRFFPSFDKMIDGELRSKWEPLPAVSRELNFNIQVRDNNSSGIVQTASDLMKIDVIADNGPFRITAPLKNQSLSSGETIMVQWNVAGTDSPPFNSPNVNIFLSVDGGDNFSLMASNTINDGSENITIPNGSTTDAAFIMVESIGNIFYSLSPKFLIDFEAINECQTFLPNESLPIDIMDNVGSRTFTFSVPNFGEEVSDVNAYIDVAHTRIGDLMFRLQSPQNKNLYLWKRQCNENQNLQITFDDAGGDVICDSPTQGTYKPNESLQVLNGFETTGDWKINIKDVVAGETGVVENLSLEVCSVQIIPLSIEDNSLIEFSLYPNPTNGKFTIQFATPLNAVTFKIFDMLGRTIYFEKGLTNLQEKKQIDITSVPSGIYILKIETETGNFSKKLLKN